MIIMCSKQTVSLLLVLSFGLCCVQCVDLQAPYGNSNSGKSAIPSTTLNSVLGRLSKYDWYKLFSKSKMGTDFQSRRNATAKNFDDDVHHESSAIINLANSDSGQSFEVSDEIEGMLIGRRISALCPHVSINRGSLSVSGRKKHIKIKGKKKLSQLLYPILIGLITAKSIIIPLIIKAVVILSKFSFFVSSLSFIISFILGIKVLLLSNNANKRSSDNTRVEVVHVPLQHKYPSYSSGGWSDRGSENKFIPITGEYEAQIYEKPYTSIQEKDVSQNSQDSYHPL